MRCRGSQRQKEEEEEEERERGGGGQRQRYRQIGRERMMVGNPIECCPIDVGIEMMSLFVLYLCTRYDVYGFNVLRNITI